MLRTRIYRQYKSFLAKFTLIVSIMLIVKLQFYEKCSPDDSVMLSETSYSTGPDACPPPISASGTCKNGKTAFRSMGFADMDVMKPLQTPRTCFDALLKPTEIPKKAKYRDKPDVTWSMVVVVKSHWNNTARRKFARETWGASRVFRGVRLFVFFVVGSPPDKNVQHTLYRESEEHGDLLQLNATENYEDVGMKTLAGMQWVSSYFPRDWIYASCDDDMLPDLRDLYLSIKRLWYQGVNESSVISMLSHPILCNYQLQLDAGPIRPGESTKNVVPKDVYSAENYPTFCSGGFYTMSVAMCQVLFQLSRSYKYFINDDVWITGFLRLAAIDRGYIPCPELSRETCAISTIPARTVRHHKGNLKNMKRHWLFVKRVMQIP